MRRDSQEGKLAGVAPQTTGHGRPLMAQRRHSQPAWEKPALGFLRQDLHIRKGSGVLFSRGPRDPWDPHLVRDGPEGCNLSTVASWWHPGIEVTALPGGFPVCHPRPRRHAHTRLASRCSAGHR